MIKLLQIKTLLTIFICCTAFIAKGQLGYNYSQYDIGTAVGFNTPYTDAESSIATQSIHFNLTFNTTPYTNFVFEAQLGKLRGGSVTSRTGRYFNNDFTAFIFRGQLQLGEILNYSQSQFENFLKNAYLSAGVGYINNHITDINRTSFKIANYSTPGENNSQTPFIPIRIGYEIKFFNKYVMPSFKVDIGYGYNFILNDELDGFNAGTRKDSYSQFTLGVKFAIGGGVTSYRKQITY